MPRRRSNSAPFAAKLAELWLATPQVMAVRLSRMALHGPNPSPADRAEMDLMSNEKVRAFSQSWVAMCAKWWMLPLQLAPALTRSLDGGSRSRGALQRATKRASTALLSAGVAPVHRTAVANAKRLTRPAKSRKR
jgi:hypothetical protein